MSVVPVDVIDHLILVSKFSGTAENLSFVCNHGKQVDQTNNKRHGLTPKRKLKMGDSF
jgi:hypothetical protein